MVTAGIDIGHESVNVVVLHDDGILGHATLVISGEVGAAARLAFETTLDGHQVLALNTYKGSERFDEIWAAHPDCVAMVPFLWRGDVRKWEVSLYSDRGFDCAAIAKAHRGGGHAGAAGFQCNALPFDL